MYDEHKRRRRQSRGFRWGAVISQRRFVAAAALAFATLFTAPPPTTAAEVTLTQGEAPFPAPGKPGACFFADVDYGGASFCVTGTGLLSALDSTGWNDAISSIRVYGAAGVQVHEHSGFGGSCATWESDEANLVDLGWNDRASSIQVFAQEAGPRPAQAELAASTAETIYSGLVNFDLRPLAANPIAGEAGAFAVAETGLLIARRTDGVLMFLDSACGSLRALSLALPPLGVELIPKRFDSGRAIRASDIRYHDIELVESGAGQRLLVTYNHYDPVRGCFQLRLDAAELPPQWDSPDESDMPLAWEQVLATEPCLPPSDERNTFGGNQAGGRMAIAPDGSVVLTTGDYEFDGLGAKAPAVSQAEASTLGRVLRVDLTTHDIVEISRGHRNPQALAVDGQGRIWAAEHAAMGGDELNLITPGSDFGWPSVTLGVLYTDRESDAKAWPGNGRQGRHEAFTPPVFAWMPSVAPSSMVVAKGLHPRWEGDLLIGTLANQSIHRLRLEGDRVLYDETIPLDRRVRDLAVANGLLHVLFDDGSLATLTPHRMSDVSDALPAPGTSALRRFGCVDCHSNPQLPRLAGVFDADIASQPDITYSEALRAVEGTWTRQRLGAFLQSPEDFAPATTMPAPDLGSDGLRQVLDELAALKP